MIKIAGSIRRSYIFPAELPVSYSFYTHLGNVFNYLPLISVVKIHGDCQFRMLYESVELGTYNMRIVADIEASFDDKAHTLQIMPYVGIKPVKAKSRLNSSITQGYFQIDSSFHDAGRQTRIEYALSIDADLPTPMGLRLMPTSVVERITIGITNKRMREIVEGFIEGSIAGYLNENGRVE